MKSESDALQLVKEKFPGQNENIEHLFSHNEHFHELCLDYSLCRRNLEKFIEDEAEKKAWVQEYEHLSSELENELSHFLIRQKTSPKPIWLFSIVNEILNIFIKTKPL